ncbi:MAG: hypothetical protein IKP73_10095 [Bacteroidales bacterium]|nr:hypothetical protein [Bacteroidales bacterium]
MAKFITICLWLLTFGCVALILYVKLGLGIPIYACENAESINDVLLNLSYSYLAGCIFYILTSYLPMYHKRKKMRIIIDSKLKQILGILEDCKKSVLSGDEYQAVETLSDELFLERIKTNRLSNVCALCRAFNMNIGQYLRSQKEQIQAIIVNLNYYQDCMGVDEILGIAKLNDSRYFELLKIVLIPMADNEKTRINLGKSLLEEISNMRSIVD